MNQNSIVPSSNNFTPEKVALIKRTIADGATDDELALFIAQCQRTGLDPFSRQIYAIQRQVYDPKLKCKVSRMVTQVSIDGLRLIADRSGSYAGQVGPFWCAVGGEWSDIWSSKDFPFAAKVGVLRKGFSEPLFSVAYWSEYCPVYDDKPSYMWVKFPTLMLAKCAEALALRRAFPLDLSGLFTSEELDRAEGDHPQLPDDLTPQSSPKETVISLIEPPQSQPDPPQTDALTRPYQPLQLQAVLAEVASKTLPASPQILEQVISFFQETIDDRSELEALCYFLSGTRDLNRASLRVVSAIHRWLKFDEHAEPSPISQEELALILDHLNHN